MPGVISAHAALIYRITHCGASLSFFLYIAFCIGLQWWWAPAGWLHHGSHLSRTWPCQSDGGKGATGVLGCPGRQGWVWLWQVATGSCPHVPTKTLPVLQCVGTIQSRGDLWFCPGCEYIWLKVKPSYLKDTPHYACFHGTMVQEHKFCTQHLSPLEWYPD